MRKLLTTITFVLLFAAKAAHATPICPTTVNTNTDCGYILTLGPGGTVTGALVSGANPYDGDDDALIGVINNTGGNYSGSIFLSGTGNGGGAFGFDGDGICTYTHAAYCSSAATGYEGPLNTFSGINLAETSGYVNINGLATGGTTFFSLEGAPQSLNLNIAATPEPSSLVLLSSGLLGLAAVARRRILSRI